MKYGYLIFLILFILALSVRTIYEYLRETGRIVPGSKLLFAFIFATMCVLWISWFNMCPLDPFSLELPKFLKITGLGLFVLGMVLAFGALIQLRGLEDITHLVTTGFFSKFRHPMYMGFMLWIIGWSIFHGAIFSLVAGLIAIGNILYWRHLEESRLILQFGDSYSEYKLGTWF